MTRKPAVSGQFYPADPEELRSDVDSFLAEADEKVSALGALCPHAGYPFSGSVMGRTIGGIDVPDTVLILNPSHSFRSPAFALWTGGDWETPLGAAPLHERLTEELAGLEETTCDDRPHVQEHSAEVIVPFLQRANPDVRLAFVCVTASAGRDALKRFGKKCAAVIEEVDPEALVVASSDMSHERGANALDVVNQNDPLAIEKMEDLDPDGLHETVQRQNITMCGVLPAVAMMSAVEARGGTEGRLVKRATSADSPLGRGAYVVGYAGMIFR